MRFDGSTFQVASDAVTGRELEALFTQAARQPIAFSRFSGEVLAASPFIAKLTKLADERRLSGQADLEALRLLNPELMSFRSWLAGSGRKLFEEALGTTGIWRYGRA
jgi:hypothetical protein